MMASIATAVLPAWRSPMIRSRWPRPIGIRVSMAFKPVCTGSCTDLRGMMPGAFPSTRRFPATLVRSPLPSMGLPSGSTTRPSRPLPTGTSTIAPVRLTTSPSLMVESLPKITTPTLSVSRFRAMPLMPPGNSTISPAWTLSRPKTRAMPSPTLSTSPTSLTCASAPKFWISRFRMAEISAGWISILRFLRSYLCCLTRYGARRLILPALAYARAFVTRNGPPDHFVGFADRSSPLHRRTQAIQLGAKRRIDHARADLDDETAEQGGIDFGMQAGLLAQPGLENGLEFGDLRVAQAPRGGDFGFGLAARGGDQMLIGAGDLAQHPEPALLRQKQHEFGGQSVGAHFFQDRFQCP